MLFKDMLCLMMLTQCDKEWHQGINKFLSKLMLALFGVKSLKKRIQGKPNKDNLSSILIWMIMMMSETVVKEKKFV